MSKRERLLFAITNNVNYLADLHKKNGVMFNKIKQELIHIKIENDNLKEENQRLEDENNELREYRDKLANA